MNIRQKASKVIEDFENGKDLKEAFKLHDITPAIFRKALHTYQELEQRLASARQMLADMLVSEMVVIADDQEQDPNRSKVMIDTRKWIASKYLPKIYGDRLDLNISETIDIRTALDRARGRLGIKTKTISNSGIECGIDSKHDETITIESKA